MIKKIVCLLLMCAGVPFSHAWAAEPQPVNQPAKPSVQLQPPKLTAEPIVPLNRIVAIVNDEIIPESELNIAVDQLKQQLAANNVQIPSEARLRSDALTQLINYKLQLQMAQRNMIKATPEEVDKTIEQIAESHKMTTEQLKSQLTAQKMSYADFRNKIAEQLIINKLQQQMVAGQVKVTDADIQAFKQSPQAGEDYRLIDFFLPLPPNPSAAELQRTLAQANNIQNKVNNGVDIDTITPHYQDLGWRNQSDLPELFLQQLKNLAPGKASDPLRAPNGYHVLKIMETRNAISNLTDDQIRNIVLRQKYEEAVKTAVERARNQAYIQIIPQ